MADRRTRLHASPRRSPIRRLYLWRTLVPVDLTPLDALPRVPVADWGRAVLALGAIGAAIAAHVAAASPHVAARRVGQLPAAARAGRRASLPSGLQATADRYTYGPAMVLSVALAVALSRMPRVRGPAAMALAVAIVAALFGSIEPCPARPSGTTRCRSGRAPWRSTPTTTWRSTTSRWRRSTAGRPRRGHRAVSAARRARAGPRLWAAASLAALLADREQRAADAAPPRADSTRRSPATTARSQHDPARTTGAGRTAAWRSSVGRRWTRRRRSGSRRSERGRRPVGGRRVGVRVVGDGPCEGRRRAAARRAEAPPGRRRVGSQPGPAARPAQPAGAAGSATALGARGPCQRRHRRPRPARPRHAGAWRSRRPAGAATPQQALDVAIAVARESGDAAHGVPSSRRRRSTLRR